ncbi:orotidine-5'-phosphate decarboxylase [bacterium]|nr:orotidine-5'-phosphate decarboxylase [bacterium]
MDEVKPDQIVLALDVDSAEEALSWAKRFRGKIGTFKVGLQLYLRSGREVLAGLQKLDVPIFLDLKFHDIPQTVEQAVRAVSQWKPRFLTVHAAGGEEMMRAAAAHVDKETSVLGVTLLTSLNAEAVRAGGWKGGIHETVECLSALSRKSGLAGVVCSPHEAAKERSAWGAAAEIVTPGIRDPKDESDDQARSKRASEAIGAGASRIVVGRPILKSDNPEAALEVILSG